MPDSGPRKKSKGPQRPEVYTSTPWSGQGGCNGKGPCREPARARWLQSRPRAGRVGDVARYKLNVTWLKDDSLEDADELPEPQDLAAEAITELEAVVDDLREIVALVEKEEGVDK